MQVECGYIELYKTMSRDYDAAFAAKDWATCSLLADYIDALRESPELANEENADW